MTTTHERTTRVTRIHRSSAALRLLVAGLMFFTACHHQPPAPAPAPVTRAPEREPSAAITSAASLLRAMHERYPSWYRTVTFTQKTTISPPSGGELVQTWYEAAKLPGRLRIETDAASKTGSLFIDDSLYRFNSGRLVSTTDDLNELLVLGFDVYAQPVARTEAQLRSQGFDLARFHEGAWEGKPIYVVGAHRGDTTSKQFWVDKDNLLFVRLIENTPLGRSDIRFENYRKVGNGWIAERVEQVLNGKRRLVEEYTNVRVNEPLPESLFDPRSWATAMHSPGGARDH